MIHPKELRVGNLVLIKGWDSKVDTINCACNDATITVEGAAPDTFYKKEDIRGKPITSSWLIGVGFKRFGIFHQWYEENGYSIFRKGAGWQLSHYVEYGSTDGVDKYIGQPMEHIHQLQNLYFYLTFKELLQ